MDCSIMLWAAVVAHCILSRGKSGVVNPEKGEEIVKKVSSDLRNEKDS